MENLFVEFVKNNENIIDRLLDFGIISQAKRIHIEMYRYFQIEKEKKGISIMQAYTNTAERFNFTEEFVRKTIYKINKDVQCIN